MRGKLTSRKTSAHLLHFFNHDAHVFLPGLELCFHFCQLCFQFHVLIMTDH